MSSSFPSILVIDNTAFVSGFDLNAYLQNKKIKVFITSHVFEEAVKNPRSIQKIEVAQAQGDLIIQDPAVEYITQIKQAATESGDIGALSKTDIELIALGLELHSTNNDQRVAIMSDDYSVQNICSRIKLQIMKYQKAGIKRNYKWEIYCPNCFHTFPPKMLGKECDFCGETLKRRVFKGKQRHL
jgi:rRNA maturation endonuclease Nob1